MESIEKRYIIDKNNLRGEDYFSSVLQEAYGKGLLHDSDVEDIQLQCIELLARRCERYNGYDSSSVRVEAAESIMKSNLFTLGLYLKSLPDADIAACALKGANISEMYKKGRRLINAKLNAAKHIYELAQKNRLNTPNCSYNATLDDNGIGVFFRAYDPDYEAHEVPASIDYQLCNPVEDLAGVEFILKYLESLLLENEFCRNFDRSNIHYLLSGYDKDYKDLLINIFEQVLTGALGCTLAGRSVSALDISEGEIRQLYEELSKHDKHSLGCIIRTAAGRVLEELGIESSSLRCYIGRSLPGIISNIACAIKLDSLDRVFVSPVNPELKNKIRFTYGKKMEDEDYRKLISELTACRYSSDKLILIKENVKSFGDLEDLLFDAQLNEEETCSVLSMLEAVELAVLNKRHPPVSAIGVVDLPEAEQVFRRWLKSYLDKLPAERKERILKTSDQLAY